MKLNLSKKIIFSLYLFLAAFVVRLDAQVVDQTDQLRIFVWSDLDPYPGHFGDEENIPENDRKNEADDDFHKMFGYAIERTKQIAPYLLQGMLTGWNFEYTPYDKRRKVDEYWSFEEIREFNPDFNNFTVHSPEVIDDKLVCHVYCDRTESQKLEYKRWISINHPRIKGNGSAPVSEGFEGIKKACSEACKNAVREYWRIYMKNKPKEISGSVLLIKAPRIYVKNGKYIVDLDFFLETDKIVEYTSF
jgi:hypothetical protein